MRHAESHQSEVRAPALEEALERLLEPLEGVPFFNGETRTAGAERLPALAARVLRGSDVFLSATLRPQDLRAGARPVVRFTVNEPCPECQGAGSIESTGEECGYCGGVGGVESERLLGLRIPPGVADGAELRVRGEGNVMPGGSAGDLYVQVRVAPRARRLKVALLVVLVVALVAFAVFADVRFF